MLSVKKLNPIAEEGMTANHTRDETPGTTRRARLNRRRDAQYLGIALNNQLARLDIDITEIQHIVLSARCNRGQ